MNQGSSLIGITALMSLYEWIREGILTGCLDQSSGSCERVLVERHGASRTPIPYAPARLQELGLLTPQRRRGYVVTIVGFQELAEILFLGALLEAQTLYRGGRH